MVNTNPYVSNSMATTRMHSIDTKNNDYNQYKKHNDPNKFNPNLIMVLITNRNKHLDIIYCVICNGSSI